MYTESVVIVNKFISRLLTVVERIRFGVHYLSQQNVLYKMSVDSAEIVTTWSISPNSQQTYMNLAI